MPNNFVIYAYPRTGSYHLVSLLNSASDIECHGEIFKTDHVELSSWHRDRMPEFTPESRNADPISFIQTLRQLNPHRHFGFKMFPNHARDVPHLRHILGAEQWKKIVLVRDPIEVYASLLRAYQTNIWMLENNTNGDVQDRLSEKVRFSSDSWKEHVSAYGHYLQRCANIKNGIIATYGQYTNQEELRRILNHVGSSASPDELSAGTRKQFTGAISDGFENWDEFVAYQDIVPAPTLPL